ncbi:DUF2207 domain-containing protein, partial [Ornithinibacter sp.]|uniref:DUF2207 domain-containing protein n=1 Tax=Ornithinibacter sp. TaxID=2862748 RepID=UPI002B595F16
MDSPVAPVRRSATPWVGFWACLGLIVAAVVLAPLALAAGERMPALQAWGPALVLPTEEQADSLSTQFQVQSDGSVIVTETIRWRFPDGEDRHGILRNVKVRAGYQDSETQYRYYELSGVVVTSPSGAPTDIAISDMGAFRQIRIGSPSQTVRGTADYVVQFRLANLVNDIGDGTAEFYYNVVDPSNGFPQLGVRAAVTAPVPATRAACFYGELGADTPCQAQAGATSTFSSPDLAAREGMSVVTSYPRDAFGDLTPDLRDGDSEAGGGSPVSPGQARALGWLAMGLGVLGPLLAGSLMGMLVWTRGRDEQYAGLTPGLTPGPGEDVPVVVGGEAPTVAVQFNPPPGVQPGMVGTILDEQVNLVDVTATLVDLAVRGHLTIARDDRGIFRADDWVLSRTAPPASAVPLAPYEQVLIDSIFAGGNQIALSQLKNRFKPTLDAVERLMYEEVVERGWFRRSPERARAGWTGLGTLLIFGSVFAAFFLGGMLSGLFADSGFPISPTWVLVGGGVVSGLIVRALGQRMAARTASGSAMLAQSRGFERYIATAEANQIKWEEAQEVFSKFLPFAIVFGLADRWAKTFEEVAAAAAAAGVSVASPTWYVGNWGTGGFSDVASSMDSFSTVAAGTFVSTPGSSGSSGFSGGGG